MVRLVQAELQGRMVPLVNRDYREKEEKMARLDKEVFRV
jgi:hypothetical protein